MPTKDLNAVQATLESINRTKPVYSGLVETFSPLFKKQAELAAEFEKSGPTPPPLDETRLMSGVPLLAGTDCKGWEQALETSAQALLPILHKMIPAALWGEKSVEELAEGHFWTGLAEARLSGDLKQFEKASVTIDGPPPAILFSIVDAIAAPVLASMAEKLGESFSRGRWDQGTCPFCGSLPTIAFLSRRDPNALEHLVGGGGKKHLHCSACGHDWEFRRDTCAACGNTDQDSKEVFFVDGVRQERIEACHKCGTYCLCIDLRELESVPQLDAVQLGLVHLDIIAQEKDLSPMTPTTWNSIES